MEDISRVCVIGSGVMGGGIAAQVANSRTKVLLLDIVDEKSDDPSNIAKKALEKISNSKPAALSHPKLIEYISVGNLRDDLSKLAECDLIIEVIIEKVEIKHELYKAIIPYLKDNAVIASNTSTLPLKVLKEILPEEIGKRFMITHFFNPPRYMELLELVYDQTTSRDSVATVSKFLTTKLGKTIVKCHDTPGFIANRIGCFLLELTVRKAVEMKLDPYFIDKVCSKLFGFPSTGIFGLYDLIGHDVMALISNSLKGALPKDDDYHKASVDNALLEWMRLSNLIGRKAGAGFYKVTKDEAGKSVKQILNFDTKEYKVIQETEVPKDKDTLLVRKDNYGEFFNSVLNSFFSYVSDHMLEISDTVYDVDTAMRLGYSFKYGPFELLTQISDQIEWAKVLKGKHKIVRKKEYAVDVTAKLVKANDSSELWNYNNANVFVIKTKMNTLNENVFEDLIDAVSLSEDNNKKLIIHPGLSKHFSVGADIRRFYEYIDNKQYKKLEAFIDLGQKAMNKVKTSNIDVISCAFGFALGGGCELLLHSNQVIAHQNISVGLVEVGVGLIPGWGGMKEMFLRSGGRKEKLTIYLSNILNQYRSESSYYFEEKFGVKCIHNMNYAEILIDAINVNRVPSAVSDQILIEPFKLSEEMSLLNKDDLAYDLLSFFQKIIDMGQVNQEQLLRLEREKFIELALNPECKKRILQKL
ncbi:MAG: enoyl-CoA hydratase/isomerase family protein [Proteobacteria bacterium]|nr:enoyl-CoA hydratase/isomerase family protein [Pseudomonadota bacterium]